MEGTMLTLARRLGVVALAAIMIVPSAPAAQPVVAADDPAGELPIGSTWSAPDPVTFVPEADRAEILRRPEAMIGFASRDLLRPRREILKPAIRDASGQPARSRSTDAPSSRSATTVAPPPPILPTPDADHDSGSPAQEMTVAGPRSDGLQVQAEGAPTVSGVIRGPTGAPLAGARVCLDEPDGQPLCVFWDDTDATGAYAIQAGSGSYHLRAYDLPYGQTYVPGYWSLGGFALLQVDAGVVTIADGDISGLDIALPDYPRIRGTLTSAGGEPIAGLGVSAGSESAVTGPDGAFAVKVGPGTSNTLWVGWDEVYRGGWYAPSGVVQDEALAVRIDVGSTDVTGIAMVVPTWPRVSGRVTNAAGDAFAGVRVSLNGFPPESVLTDADGRYDMPFMGGPEQRYLDFTANGAINQSHLVSTTMDLTLDIVLHQRPVVQGVITDVDGDPIGGIEVKVEGNALNQNWSSSALSDEAGAFRIEVGFPLPLGITVRYTDLTYATWVPGVLGMDGWTMDQDAIRTIEVHADDVIEASVTIPAYVSLTGTVRHASGAPVSGGWVGAFRPDGLHAGLGTGQIDEDGSFSMQVVPGELVLSVPGGYAGQEGFAYVSGAAAPFLVGHEGHHLDVSLPDGRSIEGRVMRSGAGVAGIEVDIFLEGVPFASAVTASDGSYAIAVPPGAYLVGFYDPKGVFAHGWYGPTGYVSDPSAAKLVGVGSVLDATGIDVSLLATKRIAGKVVDVNDASDVIRYAFVEAFVNGVFYSSQYAKADGTFSLPVAPGRVTLWVWDPNLLMAPGWRTTSGLTSNPASAAVTTIGSSSVSGITVRMPEAVSLRLVMGRETVPGSSTSVDASVTAVAHGSSASFAVLQDDGRRSMPLLKGTYLLWVDANEAYSGVTDGWSWGTTLTPDLAAATRRTISASTTVAITVPKAGRLAGQVVDRFGRSVSGVHVQLYANGAFYRGSVSTTGFYEFAVLPATYRIAFVDTLGRHRAGWLAATGFVSDYEAARDVMVVKDSLVDDLDVALPMGSPPGPPSGLIATPYHQSAMVSFTPSSSTLTRPVIHHMVTSIPGGRQCVTTGASCTVVGLENGTPYTFQVTASSIVGASGPSTPSAAVSPKAVPNAPGSVAVEPVGSAVNVSWTVPSHNGSTITGYVATISPGGQTCVPSPPTDTSCIVTGVSDGRYSVSVLAMNALGSGPARSASTTVDTLAPVVTAPVTTLRWGLATSGSNVPINVAWTAADALSGVADTTLERVIGTGSYVDMALPTATTTSLLTTLPSSATPVRFRDRAMDANGTWSANATGPSTYVTLRQETGTGIAYSGSWAWAASSSALGGKLRYTSTKGAAVSYTFTGRGVSFVTRKGTTSGKAAIYLDGVLVTTLDLHSSTTVGRWVVYGKSYSASGKHVLKIVNLATSGRPRLYVDGFATIR
jgi:hypothetical protein